MSSVLKSKPISAPTWVTALLHKLDAPVTAGNVAALLLWQLAEGTNTQEWRNNWLNTSLQGFGAKKWDLSPSIPNYPTLEDGVGATASTIKSNDPGILQAFRDNAGVTAIGQAIHNSSWCAGCTDGKYPSNFGTYAGGPVKWSESGASGSISADPGSGSTPGDADCSNSVSTHCCGYEGGLGHAAINLGPYHFFYPCQIKACLGGLIMVSGAVVMLGGVILLAKGTVVQSIAGSATKALGPTGVYSQAVAGQTQRTASRAERAEAPARSQQTTSLGAEKVGQQRAASRVARANARSKEAAAREAPTRESARTQTHVDRAARSQRLRLEQATKGTMTPPESVNYKAFTHRRIPAGERDMSAW
jgi:hypothetical protein